MLSAHLIAELHDQRTHAWHHDSQLEPENAIDVDPNHNSNWMTAVTRHHKANFDLWHIEDEARTPGATDAQLAGVKRRIDSTNQLRNNLAEELDRTLLEWLKPQELPHPQAELHSESPGLIIDRLSILALKIYHTREEAKRVDAPAGHVERNCERLAILEEQRADLAACLDVLWRHTLAGTRRFKLYRQMKMYNDPSLNPAIYRKTTSGPVR